MNKYSGRIVYAVTSIVVFAVGVHILQIREMGLYLFTLAAGVPASLALLPLSEQLEPAVGWTLGSYPHVWACQLAAVFVNVAAFSLIASTVRSFQKKRVR